MGFIAVGAGINRGKMIQELGVVDIAPLLTKLLGLEFHAPVGRLMEGLLGIEE